MNNKRRERLQGLVDRLSEALSDLEEVMGEEEEYRDNIPENLQGSERYEKADQCCYELQDAVDSLEQAISNIESAIEV